jgi:hypothetical protein
VSSASQKPLSRSADQGAELQAGRSFLERLGVLYEDQTRLTMVTELYMREMSPMQYFEEVGGTSYASVRRHFQKLVAYGWLRKVRTLKSGRGRPEHLYRSTELAVIDDETWSELPISVRDAFTLQLLEEMRTRFRAAIEAGTLDRQTETVGSLERFALDELGWDRANATLDRVLSVLSQEQTDAKIRLETSAAPSMLLVVELGGFVLAESEKGAAPADSLPVAKSSGSLPSWGFRIAKVFSDRRNLAIIRAVNERAMSPSQLHDLIGEGVSLEGYDHRCKTLANLGWIAKVEELTGGHRRGATENFYRAARPALSVPEAPERLRTSDRARAEWERFEEFGSAAVDAVRAGTFNGGEDRHLTLSTLLVDETGWKQITDLLRECEKTLRRIGQEADGRLRLGGRKSCEAAFFVAGFEGPLSKRP